MATNKQVVIIHGGDAFGTYEDYLIFLKNREINFEKHGLRKNGWQANLASRLGDEFQIIRPEMPCQRNAKYLEWKIWFEKFFPFFENDLILVGSSLGGSFLAKYLAENDFPKTIKAVILMAAAYGNNEKDYLFDFFTPSDLTKFARQVKTIILYHSQDDNVVPFSDLNKFQLALPKAQVKIFTDRQHFNQSEFPELVQEIKSL